MVIRRRRRRRGAEPAPAPVLDLHGAIQRLAARRPVFHSEADFQHALAWQIHADHPAADIRLETRPLPEENLRLDLQVGLDGRRVAVECKYLVRELDIRVAGERFALRTQSAHDIRRYDTLKDVARVEHLVERGAADEGFVVAVTNDAGHWKTATRPDTFDADFRLHGGRIVTGRLAWADQTGPGTMKGREAPIDLNGAYRIDWHDFATPTKGPAGKFRYLLIEVPPRL